MYHRILRTKLKKNVGHFSRRIDILNLGLGQLRFLYTYRPVEGPMFVSNTTKL